MTFAGVARSEADAALAVADGKADAAFGLPAWRASSAWTSCRSRASGSTWSSTAEPISSRRSRRWSRSPVARRFSRKAEELGGYALSTQFGVHYNAP